MHLFLKITLPIRIYESTKYVSCARHPDKLNFWLKNFATRSNTLEQERGSLQYVKCKAFSFTRKKFLHKFSESPDIGQYIY